MKEYIPIIIPGKGRIPRIGSLGPKMEPFNVSFQTLEAIVRAPRTPGATFVNPETGEKVPLTFANYARVFKAYANSEDIPVDEDLARKASEAMAKLRESVQAVVEGVLGVAPVDLTDEEVIDGLKIAITEAAIGNGVVVNDYSVETVDDRKQYSVTVEITGDSDNLSTATFVVTGPAVEPPAPEEPAGNQPGVDNVEPPAEDNPADVIVTPESETPVDVTGTVESVVEPPETTPVTDGTEDAGQVDGGAVSEPEVVPTVTDGQLPKAPDNNSFARIIKPDTSGKGKNGGRR